MDTETIQQLIRLNNEFYQNFGAAFAATRRRIQPGIRRILESIPLQGDWLDLGCGSGSLAREWALQKRTGSYHGLDFSRALLTEAEKTVRDVNKEGLDIHFSQADLGDEKWADGLTPTYYDGILLFAALHHIPGHAIRQRILRRAQSLIKPGGRLIHSEWQFQNSPKLMARIIPWREAGFDENELETGDTLLDWRYALPGQAEETGRRYVHCFQEGELKDLANESGFKILEEFESDGSGGRLGLYQVWQVV